MQQVLDCPFVICHSLLSDILEVPDTDIVFLRRVLRRGKVLEEERDTPDYIAIR